MDNYQLTTEQRETCWARPYCKLVIDNCLLIIMPFTPPPPHPSPASAHHASHQGMALLVLQGRALRRSVFNWALGTGHWAFLIEPGYRSPGFQCTMPSGKCPVPSAFVVLEHRFRLQ